MLGSQATQYAGSIAGYEIGVPEIAEFGYAQFQSALATSDDWALHDGAELVFLLQGEACWELENELLVPITAGQCALFPTGSKHRITNGIYPPSASFWMVMNPPAETERATMLTDSNRIHFDSVLGRNGLTQQISEQALQSVTAVIRLMKNKRTFSGAPLLVSELRAHLHLLMVEIWKSHDQNSPSSEPDELVQEVLKVIHKQYDDFPKVSALADRLGCTRGHLHTVFRRDVGMSPSDYIARVRIKRACEQLRAGESSVTDIALDLDFANSQHFSRTFRKYLGLTPSEYRNQRLGKAIQ